MDELDFLGEFQQVYALNYKPNVLALFFHDQICLWKLRDDHNYILDYVGIKVLKVEGVENLTGVRSTYFMDLANNIIFNSKK